MFRIMFQWLLKGYYWCAACSLWLRENVFSPFRSIKRRCGSMSDDTSKVPTRPDFFSFIAPYLCSGVPYDHRPDGFRDFPSRGGWLLHDDPDKQEYGRLDGSDSAEMVTEKVAFYQAWLFFGLLSETSVLYGLDVDIEAEFLIEGASGGKVIHTEALNRLPAQWSRAAQQYDDWRARHSQVLDLLTYVNTRMFGLRQFGGRGRLHSFEDCQVLLAVEMAFRAVLLTLAQSGLYKDENLRPLLAVKRGTYQLRMWTTSHQALRKFNMCRSEWRMLKALDRELPYIFFLTLLERNRTQDHGDCTDFRCMADQIDEATYKVVHVDEECRCASVEVDVQKVCEFLESGKIPLIAVDDNLGVRIVSDENFVAISHVWSHGLGNPNMNALPLCQLRRLRTAISALDSSNPDLHLRSTTSDTYAFWMDTLCIPVSPDLKAYRKKAIALMGKTYHCATAVLVLDRSLKQLTSTSTSLIQQCLWLLICGWLRRLWTLQEAALARTLFLDLQDGPTSYMRPDDPSALIANRLRRERLTPAPMKDLISDILLTRELELLIKRRIPLARHIREESTHPDHPTPYQYLAAATESRCTSKLKDEPLILATIMGHENVAAMLQEPDISKRMGMWHVAMRSIPTDIIFLDNQIVTLPYAPFRWAPTSLMEYELARQTTDVPAVCDGDGLHVKLSAFILQNGQACEVEKVGVKWYLKDVEAGTIHKVTHNMDKTLPKGRCAILFNLDQHRFGAVVEILGERGEDSDIEYVVTIVGLVAFHKKLGMPPEKTVKPGRDVVMCKGTALEQRWCVT
ncbi:hypothetical protein DFP73DRAFT_569385 [Morchella snyderi]|nr:hypothetical protein DFP73DRAFT_569385 [Morchella snyderi]